MRERDKKFLLMEVVRRKCFLQSNIEEEAAKCCHESKEGLVRRSVQGRRFRHLRQTKEISVMLCRASFAINQVEWKAFHMKHARATST